jgi:hypothetical protein
VTTGKEPKPNTKSGTPAGTGTPPSGINLVDLVNKAQAMGLGGDVASKGPVYTKQDAEAAVQSIYQQLLGRNAVGAERSKAISVFLGQGADTGASGRQQAIINMVQNDREFIVRQENKYMDAIYNRIAQDVREAQG